MPAFLGHRVDTVGAVSGRPGQAGFWVFHAIVALPVSFGQCFGIGLDNCEWCGVRASR